MANDLQTITETARQTPCSRLHCDAGLLRLVDGIQPGIEQRLPNREERAALADLRTSYEAWLIPADSAAIEESVGMLALAYPALKVSPEEADARIELYTRALADIPRDILHAACMAALRELTFFPSVAEIRARCHGLAQRQWRFERIRTLILRHDREWKAPERVEKMTADQRAEFEAIMRKMGAAA